jgi:DNA primase
MAPGTPPMRNNDDKERVRDASDIVRIIGEHVALKPKGREFVCLCPFHDDHKPSMTVVPAKQIFHCFVCQTGGDVFSFVEKYHKMDFREALEYLAERGNITLTRSRLADAPNGRANDSGEHSDESGALSRADLLNASAAAGAFFSAILAHPEHGRAAREIIQRRGISEEMVSAFGIGASPDRWDGLVLTIQKQRLDPRAFLAAGLLKPRESDGTSYDAFRNRLIFPIHDQIGRIIGFGGRKIDEEDEPKYLNSPESRLFDKSSTLYGLHQAAREIQKRRLAIITEGYTDTIACHQAGVTNAVATLGTALTPRHAVILRRLCDTVVLLFDGDSAGQRAADRAVEVFFAQDIDVKIATLSSVTDAKDPDELLKRERGRELLDKAITSATELLEYRYRRIRLRLAGAGTAALSRAIEEELATLVQLGLGTLPVLRRRLIVKKIAAIAGVDEETIWRSIPAGRRPSSAQHTSETAPDAETVRRLSPRQLILGCILCEPALWDTLNDAQREHLDPELFESQTSADVAHAVFDLAACGGWTFTDLCGHLEEAESRADATRMMMHLHALTEGDPVRLRLYLSDCMRSLTQGVDPPMTIEDIRRRRTAIGDNRRVIPGARTG